MKKITLLLALIITFCSLCRAQTLIPMLMKNGRYSYVKIGTKEVAIERQFDDARPFINGIAFVQLKGNWGAINQQGEIVLKPIYSEIEGMTNGYYRAKIANDDNSNIISNSNISEYIFLNDKFLLTEFSFLAGFSDGYAVILNNNQNALIVDTTFKIIADLGRWHTEGNMQDISDVYKEGFFLTKDQESLKYNYINLNGKYLLEKDYDLAESFNDGLAKVSRYGKFGFIDKFGDEVIPIS